ncbi:MAG: zinc ribbon domain-containing protein [Candidatus Altiarchaeota archaeon]
MNRLQKWTTLGVLLFILLVYLSYGTTSMDLFKPVLWFIAGILFLISLTSGLISSFVGIIIAILAFMSSLPLITNVSATMILFSNMLYKSFINKIVKGILRRIPLYQKTEDRIKRSRTYILAVDKGNHLLKSLGLRKPKRMIMVEVKACIHCGALMPISGRFCTVCGKENE